MKSRLLPIYIIFFFCIATSWACQKKSKTSQTSGTVEWAEPVIVDSTYSGSEVDTMSIVVKDSVTLDTLKSIDEVEYKVLSDSAASSDIIQSDLKIHPFAIVGFTAAIAGLGFSVITPFICMAAFIFSAIALDRIKRKPEKFKGKRLAKWGLILSALGMLVYLGAVVVMGL